MALNILQLRTFLFSSPHKDILFAYRSHIVEPRKTAQFILVWRYLRHRVHHTLRLRRPHPVKHLVLHIHSQCVRLRIVQQYQRRVLFVHRVVYCQDVAYSLVKVQVTVAEICIHIPRRQLVIMFFLVGFLHRQCLSVHVCIVNGRVVHIHIDHLAEQLSSFVPYYRVFVHRHTRVFGVIHQRVAYCLHILPVRANLII